jgi:hypothetical protein
MPANRFALPPLSRYFHHTVSTGNPRWGRSTLHPATRMKSNDARKEKKKLPSMTAKEKKQAKRDKKAAKG